MQVESPMPTCAAEATQPVVLLCVTGDAGWRAQYRLVIDATVVIGSSHQCGLTLSGDDVAAAHCSVRWDENAIWLQDWGSSQGTFVDDERITTETPVEPGSTIRVGSFTIRLHRDASPPPQETPVDQNIVAHNNAAPPNPALAAPRVSEFANPAGGPAPLIVQDRNPTEVRGHTEDQETFDMLRAEVEQLQLELAERDAQLAEVWAAEHEPETQADDPASDQLLERLEDLLAELDRSDDRMAALEELLRISEEAHSAEREERRQLESWLGDIESVIGEREATWDAEMTLLRNQVAAAATERDQLVQQLTQPAADGNSQLSAEQATEFSRQIERLQQQLGEAKAAESRHEEELRQREVQLAKAAERENVLREEHLKLAEERAALTRLRAELAAERADCHTRSRDERTDIDSRVRVFREHLREIHEEERQDDDTRSLASRVGRLWKRIEGHR